MQKFCISTLTLKKSDFEMQNFCIIHLLLIKLENGSAEFLHPDFVGVKVEMQNFCIIHLLLMF